MNNVDIETFWAVVENGNMTAAAEALFITQPTLSSRVQSLENEVGAKLFIRGRGMKESRLTEAGENFLPLARRWRTLLSETDDFAAAKRQEYLHLAAVYTANRYILPPVYQRFLEREMPTALWVETMRAPDAISAVTQGVCDLAIVDMLPDHDQRLDVRLLFRESFMLGTSQDNDSLGESVHPSQLNASDELLVSGQPEITQWHNYWFGTEVKPVLRTDMIETIPTCGKRWSIIPASAVGTYCQQYRWKVCRLSDAPNDRVFYLVRRNGASVSEAEKLLLDDLKSEAEKVSGITVLM